MKIPRVAVVGGGISGTLASLVLRNRNLSPVLIDMGKAGVGGRMRSGRSKLSPHVDAGVQFFRASDPRLATVFGMLEGAGMLAEWKGRFGFLGSEGGGFLPSSIVGNAGLGLGRDSRRGGAAANDEDEENAGDVQNQNNRASDAGDFCGFVKSHAATTYVACPSNSDLCQTICDQAGIDVLTDTKVLKATPVAGGGWRLHVKSGDDESDTSSVDDEIFDALILTQDMTLAASTIRSISEAEAEASEADAAAGGTNNTVRDRLNRLAKDLESIRDHGKMPLFTWSGKFDPYFSQTVPFDAASVPGSNYVQFLARESSKPGRLRESGREANEDDIWTAVSTSAFAADVLGRLGSTREASDEASKVMSDEVSNLLSAATAVDAIGSDSGAKTTANGDASIQPSYRPRDASAVRWGAALTSKTLGLKEDSIALAPWRLAISGDFIREQDAQETPFESAALSGLEAGERVAAFFAGSDKD
jgi:hypothetical protein